MAQGLCWRLLGIYFFELFKIFSKAKTDIPTPKIKDAQRTVLLCIIGISSINVHMLLKIRTEQKIKTISKKIIFLRVIFILRVEGIKTFRINGICFDGDCLK
jgi:hypothetical protein